MKYNRKTIQKYRITEHYKRFTFLLKKPFANKFVHSLNKMFQKHCKAWSILKKEFETEQNFKSGDKIVKMLSDYHTCLLLGQDYFTYSNNL